MYSERRITLGFSTCPNDTFIFDALVHYKISNAYFLFDPVMADVEELNRMARTDGPDVIKISYAQLPAVSHRYAALTSGGALGFGCGPLLVARDAAVFAKNTNPLVVIPGEHTTANLLLKRYYPGIVRKEAVLFSAIEDHVALGFADAGLIIHESRFTFREKGLAQVADLGDLWHRETGLPVPLGCIAVKRDLSPALQLQMNEAVRMSVLFALANPEQTMGFVRENAASLSDDVIKQHINLYVNEFSVNLGDRGKQAVRLLLEAQLPAGTPLFVDEQS